MSRKRVKSRADRWNDAVDSLRSALDAVDAAMADADAAASELAGVKDEYQEWYDNMPDGLRDSSPTGEKLAAVVDIDTDVEGDLDGLRSLLEAADGADLPLGWGRD